MRTVTLLIYKDFNMTELWSDREFVVDFQGDKARVHDNSGLSSMRKVSRFNKLSRLGGVTQGKVQLKNFYGLTVNGNRVFFQSTYSITK